MAGRQARTITPAQMDMLMQHIRGRRDSARRRVIVLLSHHAGLRAAEIAKLEWSMILDPTGRVGQSIELEDRIAKKKSGHRIPLHPELHHALVTLQRGKRHICGPVIQSKRSGHMLPNSLVNWFKCLYRELGFTDCSSHSGRRTGTTKEKREHTDPVLSPHLGSKCPAVRQDAFAPSYLFYPSTPHFRTRSMFGLIRNGVFRLNYDRHKSL
jgi:integrase